MPIIDVYVPTCAFDDKHAVAQRLAGALMTIEGIPDIAGGLNRDKRRAQWL
jgi:hypothetical protein